MANEPDPVQLVANAATTGDPLIGKVIDRYRVIEKIGEGGMGSVYRVEHVMLQKNMAMKLLRFELSQNQELVTRFQNEAIAASRIGQENIVAVTDFGRTSEGLVYFVMEELQGNPLSVEIHLHPRFPVQRTIGISAQVCRALHAAHNAGIIHRDLKPENIILTNREGFADFAKILDFGISKMSELSDSKDSARLTRAGMIVGTPEYMSPEQAAGKPVDARSDIYSLGVVIYEMIAGKLPFEADNPIAMLMRHQTAQVPAFATAVVGLKVPAKLERVVRRALSKMPEERQDSMADLLNDLQECAEGLELTQPALRLPSGVPSSSTSGIRSSPSRPMSGSGPKLKPRTPAPLAESASPDFLPDSLAQARATAAFRPKRTLWIAALALLIIGGGAVAAFAGRSKTEVPIAPAPVAAAPEQAPPATPAPLPTLHPVPTPTAEATPTPPPVAAAPTPAPVPTPTPAPVAAPARTAEKTPEPHHIAAHPKKVAQRPAPTVRPGAEPTTRPPADPYEKVDELKKPY